MTTILNDKLLYSIFYVFLHSTGQLVGAFMSLQNEVSVHSVSYQDLHWHWSIPKWKWNQHRRLQLLEAVPGDASNAGMKGT